MDCSTIKSCSMYLGTKNIKLFGRVFFFAVSRNPAAVVAGNEKSILKTFPWEEEEEEGGDGKRERREQQAKVAEEEEEKFPNQHSPKNP